MKSKLVKGAFFVTAATFFVKILSIAYKIPYQNITGDKGFYIYQQMYPLFALVVAISGFSFPLAISESITQQKIKSRIISSSFYALTSASIVLSLCIYFSNPILGQLMGDPYLSGIFYSLIPVILLAPLLSVLRGHLYSHVDSINQVAISIIIEQLFRVSFIVFILYLYVNLYISNLYLVAKFSFLGFGLGIFIAILYLINKFDFKSLNINYFNLKLSLLILKRGLFLLISASILLLFQLIDSLTIIKQLSISVSLQTSMVIKGIYDRGLPIIQTGIFFVSPLLASIIPHINKKGDYTKLLMFIFYVSLPATIGLIFVLKDVNLLLFHDNRYTYVLQISAITILLYSLLLTLSTFTTNHKNIIYIVCIGLLFKYIGNNILIVKYGIVGASISSVVSLSLMLLIIALMSRKIISVSIGLLIKIIFANVFLILALYISRLIAVLDHLMIQIILGMLSYLMISFLLKIKKEIL